MIWAARPPPWRRPRPARHRRAEAPPRPAGRRRATWSTPSSKRPTSPNRKEGSMDAGLLIARLIVGLGLAAHGTQKLFGWFGGHGLTGTGGFFESLGFRPGVLFALAAGLGELGGGLLTAAGFLGPVGPALITVVMLVAILTVHRANGFFASANGVEMPLMYLTAALPLAFTGAGSYSVDARLGFDALRGPTVAWIALAAAIVVALINVALRRPSAPARIAA